MQIIKEFATFSDLNANPRTIWDSFRPEDGVSLKNVCLLQICRIGVLIYDWFDIPWLKNYYNFGFDHFNMSWKKAGISGLVDCLLGNAGPFASGDWILPDLTIQGTMKLNSQLRTFPDTYYFSYATKRTRKVRGITVPSGILGIHPLLFVRVLQMSQWTYPPNAPLPYKGYRLVLECIRYLDLFFVIICSSLLNNPIEIYMNVDQPKFYVTACAEMRTGMTMMER